VDKKTLVCDSQTGICEGADDEIESSFKINQEKVEVYYFTDPLCSHCWATEKIIQSFKNTFSHYMNFHYVMGGLLKFWDGSADKSNSLNDPNDVYSHWKDVGRHYDVPIDGSLWFKTPINSSYPASKVFLTINTFDTIKAELFLRLARIAAFVTNKDISNDEVLIDLINQSGLNGSDILKESKSHKINKLLDDDFNLAKEFGVKDYPNIVMINKDDEGIRVVGSKETSTDYTKALHKISGNECLIPRLKISLEELLEQNKILFIYEIKTIFNLEASNLTNFIENNLKKESFSLKEILGFKYIEKL
jgi:predicted DsbA family dithiol-disulfide isomerase